VPAAVITPVPALDGGNSTRADVSKTGLPVSEAVITAVPAPDDVCQHPKHVELHTEL